MVAAVTPDSVQAEVMGARVTAPGALMRLTKTVRVAPEIWLAVVPAGSEVRSNWRSAVLPFPT
jgi:hypothetical protein